LNAIVCLTVRRGSPDDFPRLVPHILHCASRTGVETRLAFGRAQYGLYTAIAALNPECGSPKRYQLPAGAERFELSTVDGRRVLAWHTERHLSREELVRLMLHDVPLEAEYAVCLDQDTVLADKWWEALGPQLAHGADVIAPRGWHEYAAGEVERLQGQPWYVGVPVERREGRAGVGGVRGGFFAIRSALVRETGFPDPARSMDIRLGEMAHQLGWRWIEFDPAAPPADNPAASAAVA
jgi:hypothetical protein